MKAEYAPNNTKQVTITMTRVEADLLHRVANFTGMSCGKLSVHPNAEFNEKSTSKLLWDLYNVTKPIRLNKPTL